MAFVAALQLLPPRQRAALILREVLDVPAASVADLLGTTTASVNSALQRARAAGRARWASIPTRRPSRRPSSVAVVNRFVAAFERADVAALTALLADDVVLEMPPMWNWYRGRDDFGAFHAAGLPDARSGMADRPALGERRGGLRGVRVRHAPHRDDPHRGSTKG